jgi:hypothetical protein
MAVKAHPGMTVIFTRMTALARIFHQYLQDFACVPYGVTFEPNWWFHETQSERIMQVRIWIDTSQGFLCVLFLLYWISTGI